MSTTSTTQSMAEQLAAALRGTEAIARDVYQQRIAGTAVEKALAPCADNAIENLKRLSGGANMETWSFDWCLDQCRLPLILRRKPSAEVADEMDGLIGIPIDLEARIVKCASEHQVPVAAVILILESSHGLGEGYIMTREGGEALPKRILTDEKYAAARPKLAYQCGEALARIHAVPVDALPAEITNLGVDGQLDKFQADIDRFGNVSPVHQLGINWLRENKPQNDRHCLVHGDFRNGNLLIDEQGLATVLDWELAHIGSPAEDLGYLCANVWRFGQMDKPVGGFGDYQDLLDGYRSLAGWAPSIDELRYWEVYGALGWGLCCQTMLSMYHSGYDRSLERMAIGRRMSESEVDILLLLEQLA